MEEDVIDQAPKRARIFTNEPPRAESTHDVDDRQLEVGTSSSQLDVVGDQPPIPSLPLSSNLPHASLPATAASSSAAKRSRLAAFISRLARRSLTPLKLPCQAPGYLMSHPSYPDLVWVASIPENIVGIPYDPAVVVHGSEQRTPHSEDQPATSLKRYKPRFTIPPYCERPGEGDCSEPFTSPVYLAEGLCVTVGHFHVVLNFLDPPEKAQQYDWDPTRCALISYEGYMLPNAAPPAGLNSTRRIEDGISSVAVFTERREGDAGGSSSRHMMLALAFRTFVQVVSLSESPDQGGRGILQGHSVYDSAEATRDPAKDFFRDGVLLLPKGVIQMAFSKDGRHLFLGCMDGSLIRVSTAEVSALTQVKHLASLEEHVTYRFGPTCLPLNLLVVVSEHELLLGFRGGQLLLVDAQDPQTILRRYSGHQTDPPWKPWDARQIHTFDSQLRLFAIAGPDNVVRIWSFDESEPMTPKASKDDDFWERCRLAYTTMSPPPSSDSGSESDWSTISSSQSESSSDQDEGAGDGEPADDDTTNISAAAAQQEPPGDPDISEADDIFQTSLASFLAGLTPEQMQALVHEDGLQMQVSESDIPGYLTLSLPQPVQGSGAQGGQGEGGSPSEGDESESAASEADDSSDEEMVEGSLEGVEEGLPWSIGDKPTQKPLSLAFCSWRAVEGGNKSAASSSSAADHTRTEAPCPFLLAATYRSEPGKEVIMWFH